MPIQTIERLARKVACWTPPKANSKKGSLYYPSGSGKGREAARLELQERTGTADVMRAATLAIQQRLPKLRELGKDKPAETWHYQRHARPYALATERDDSKRGISLHEEEDLVGCGLLEFIGSQLFELIVPIAKKKTKAGREAKMSKWRVLRDRLKGVWDRALEFDAIKSTDSLYAEFLGGIRQLAIDALTILIDRTKLRGLEQLLELLTAWCEW